VEPRLAHTVRQQQCYLLADSKIASVAAAHQLSRYGSYLASKSADSKQSVCSIVSE